MIEHRSAPDQTKAMQTGLMCDKMQLKTMICARPVTIATGTRMDSNHGFKTHKTKTDLMDKSTATQNSAF